MVARSSSWGGRLLRHTRNRLISGTLLLVPLVVTLLVLRFLYGILDGYVKPVREAFVRLGLPDSEALGVVCALGALLLVLYAGGALTTRMLGRRALALGESLVVRIPLVKSVYSATKKVVDMLSTSTGSQFKSVVIVEFPRPGMKTIAFLTGTVRDEHGREHYKVYIPTAPNPTSGYIEILPPEQVRVTRMPVEEGLKMVVSGGMISPEIMELDLPGAPGNERTGV